MPAAFGETKELMKNLFFENNALMVKKENNHQISE
jgi:hypothetical protein